MHLKQMTDDILATPQAASEWGDFLPVIRAVKDPAKRLILVSGADWQATNPARITKGYEDGLFIRPQGWDLVKEVVKDKLGLQSTFTRRAKAQKEEYPATIDHYGLEDILHSKMEMIAQYPGIYIQGPFRNDQTIYASFDRNVFRRVLGIPESHFNIDAVPGTDRDWRTLCMAHELTHARPNAVHVDDPAFQAREELEADAGAEKIYRMARNYVPDMHPDVPNMMQVMRTLLAFTGQLEYHVPLLAPFVEGRKDAVAMVGIMEDFSNVHALLRAGTTSSGMRGYTGAYVISHMLDQTGILNERELQMTALFRGATEAFYTSGIIVNGPAMLAEAQEYSASQREAIRRELASGLYPAA